MRDQPDFSENPSTPSTPPDAGSSPIEAPDGAAVAPRVNAEAQDQACARTAALDTETPDVATPAEVATPPEDVTPARPTLVTVDALDRAVPRWLKIAAGLGGIVLLAIIGWVILERDPARPLPTATADKSPTVPAGPQPSAPPAPSTPTEPHVTAATPPSPPDPTASGAGVEPPRSEAPPTPTPPAVAADTTAPRTADAPPPRSDDDDKPEPMDRYEATVRIEKGDTLEGLLRDMDFAPEDIRRAAAALKAVLKGTRLPVGETITLQVQTPQEADGKPTLQALVVRPEARREISLERGADGYYTSKQRTFDVVPKLVRATGVVRGSLRGSVDAAGIPPTVLAEMLRAFSWDVNFQYDVKGGDRFAVLIEQSYTTDGRLVSPGRVLWAQLTTGGGKSTFSVYRFKPDRGAEFFFYGNGQSVVKSLLRTPMNLSRISSRYGMREHPILGFTSMHSGVDFAAPYGTPILAAGAGTVVQASPYGGYGNWVKIDHGGGVATGYAHMARYAPGIRPGVRVRQGQVVGFVGSTGMSTGPHLHYELHQKGRPVNPLNARATQRASLGGKDLERFKAMVHKTDRARDAAELIAAR